MSPVSDAKSALETALGTVDDVRVQQLGDDIEPMSVVVGPPTLNASTYCTGFGSASFDLYVIAELDEYALERLWEKVPLVQAAIEGLTVAVVPLADPATYGAGGRDLPCYRLTVEYPLSEA